MHLVYNRFSLTIVYCINLFDDQPSFISILYIEYLWNFFFLGLTIWY